MSLSCSRSSMGKLYVLSIEENSFRMRIPTVLDSRVRWAILGLAGGSWALGLDHPPSCNRRLEGGRP